MANLQGGLGMGSSYNNGLGMPVRQVILLNLMSLSISLFGDEYEKYQVSGMCIFLYSMSFGPHNNAIRWVKLSQLRR